LRHWRSRRRLRRPSSSWWHLRIAQPPFAFIEEDKGIGARGAVKILPNAGEGQRMEVLRMAKVYLHSTKYEHFGVAVVEAMSAGLVPIVHKSGNPWIDILQRRQGVYGYAYEGVDDASTIIVELLDNEDLRSELSGRAIERVKAFGLEAFRERVVRVVESPLEIRHSTSENMR